MFRRELDLLFDTEIIFGHAPNSFHSVFEKIVGLWKSYFGVALKACFRTGHQDIIYAWHAVIGLFFASLCRLFRIKDVTIVIAQLIVPQKSESAGQRLKTAFTRYALKSVHTVIAYSRVEIEQFKRDYSNGRTQFIFMPLGIDNVPNAGVSEQGYIFSGGRSNRDYGVLASAMRGLEYTAHIAAQRFNIQQTHLPDNVHAHFDTFGKDFLRLLSEATLVVIPLDRPDESSGQLVLLQAMMLGKAIIVTENRGIADYFIPGESALTVAPHDSDELRKKIDHLMKSSKERVRLGTAARKMAAKFTLQSQAKNVAYLLFSAITANTKTVS